MKRRKKIFIIDDDEAIGISLKDVLDTYYEVSIFTTASTAVKNAQEKSPDGILLDYFLPGENTLEVIQSLRSYSEQIPIIVMSANVHLIKNKEKLAIQEFLAKPFSLDKVLTSLERHI